MPLYLYTLNILYNQITTNIFIDLTISKLYEYVKMWGRYEEKIEMDGQLFLCCPWRIVTPLLPFIPCKMSSSQTIKLGNISVTVSVETTPTPTTTPTPSAPAPAEKSMDEILFNAVAARMKIPLNTKFPSFWEDDDGVATMTFEKYIEETSWAAKSSDRTVQFIVDYLQDFIYDTDIGKEFEKYQLFKQIVKKREMTFSETMFTVYLEWAKTYVPQGKESRLKRMEKFLDMHGKLFDIHI
jgi:hypothetical protein